MSEKLLQVRDLAAGYGRVGVLENISLDVSPGQIVAVVGSNGAGKSTLLKTISGLLVPTAGRILFDGASIAGVRPGVIVGRGLLHVAEGRRLFRAQSVADNLELGLYGAGLARVEEQRRLAEIFTMFPILQERRHLPAGALSGGQQQMLAIGQALIRAPRLLMLDEPSLGLAPSIVDQVLDVVVALRSKGCAIILVEQFVERALEIADFGYVLQNGRLVGSAPAGELARSDIVHRAYLGQV